MALTALLAPTDVAVAKVLGCLPWARLYRDGQDITETFTSYIELLDYLAAQTPSYHTRAGRSRRH